jgi:hypothetical protein
MINFVHVPSWYCHGIGVMKFCTNDRGNLLPSLWALWGLLVPVLLRNRWYNACSLGIQIISSHIFRESNCCADKLANMGHSVHGAVWLSVLPPDLLAEFYLDRCGMPCYMFP